jgi:hypothetical protein
VIIRGCLGREKPDTASGVGIRFANRSPIRRCEVPSPRRITSSLNDSKMRPAARRGARSSVPGRDSAAN